MYSKSSRKNIPPPKVNALAAPALQAMKDVEIEKPFALIVDKNEVYLMYWWMAKCTVSRVTKRVG